MAERTMTVCDVDDRRGGTVVATATVRLDLAGDVHEIDLCEDHLQELRAALATILPPPSTGGRRGRARAGAPERRAQRKPGTRTARSRRTAAGSNPDGTGRALAFSNDVRQWARDNGIEVKGQGRMSTAVVEQYRAAHS